jgi:hypothetical protein
LIKPSLSPGKLGTQLTIKDACKAYALRKSFAFENGNLRYEDEFFVISFLEVAFLSKF